MLNVRRRPILHVLPMQPDRPKAVLTAKLGSLVANGVGNVGDHPIPYFLAIAHKKLLHLATVDLLFPDLFAHRPSGLSLLTGNLQVRHERARPAAMLVDDIVDLLHQANGFAQSDDNLVVVGDIAF